jgi:signal transduction histidine kinase
MKYLSYGVMVYMLLALIWWAVLLSRNNQTLYEHKLALSTCISSQGIDTQSSAHNIDKIHQFYKRNQIMILGEGVVFGILLVLGMWFIQKAYNKEIVSTIKQKNFLLSITHELKSPIAAINLTTETLIKRSLSPKMTVELHESILKESTRLEKLISNLLMAAKLDHDYKYHFEKCLLHEKVAYCIKRLKLQNPETEIISEFEGDDISIDADHEAMISLINNLLENSIKYSGQHASIRVKVETVPPFAVLSVADEGIGIPDHEKAKVTDQFYRVGNENTRQTKGTGLGLYIANKIIAAHHGKLTISDNIPQGTIVSVSIPLSKNK